MYSRAIVGVAASTAAEAGVWAPRVRAPLRGFGSSDVGRCPAWIPAAGPLASSLARRTWPSPRSQRRDRQRNGCPLTHVLCARPRREVRRRRLRRPLVRSHADRRLPTSTWTFWSPQWDERALIARSRKRSPLSVGPDRRPAPCRTPICRPPGPVSPSRKALAVGQDQRLTDFF